MNVNFTPPRLQKIQHEKRPVPTTMQWYAHPLQTLYFRFKTRLAYIRWRLTNPSNNLNHIELITGPTRGGKSTLAVVTAADVDPTFTREKRVFYNLNELVSWEESEIPGKCEGHCAAVMETTVVADQFSNRDPVVRQVADLLATHGYKRLGIFFCGISAGMMMLDIKRMSVAQTWLPSEVYKGMGRYFLVVANPIGDLDLWPWGAPDAVRVTQEGFYRNNATGEFIDPANILTNVIMWDDLPDGHPLKQFHGEDVAKKQVLQTNIVAKTLEAVAKGRDAKFGSHAEDAGDDLVEVFHAKKRAQKTNQGLGGFGTRLRRDRDAVQSST